MNRGPPGEAGWRPTPHEFSTPATVAEDPPPAEPDAGAAPPFSPRSLWHAQLLALRKHKAKFGSADAVSDTSVGRWCAAQRRARERQALDAEQVAALDALGFSWGALGADWEALDFEQMLLKLAAYRAEHGDTAVPKKYAPDPTLGRWVAGVRRTAARLDPAWRAALDAAGFDWTARRKCGSAFQVHLRELAAFREAHGHCGVEGVLGPKADLSRWVSAIRTAHGKGLLSDVRRSALEGVGFEFI
jgi:hypothetical protein